jgi:hypothetical protein
MINKRLFLLGGYDLEMVEIRKILIKKSEVFYDNKLEWGAKLSDYKKFFDDEHDFAGIELTKDIKPPKSYIEIDHHNEKNSLPSSIEQIADMLGIELDRWQKLVAVNDKGYIPAMEAMGATKEEIDKIRKEDRKAQGVTETDEMSALKSIQEQLTVVRGVTMVKSLTPRFSAVTDRLYPYSKLLIYNDRAMTYYGENAGKLKEVFNELIISGVAYSGGGPSGFFGIKKDALSLESLSEIINKITCIINS